MPTFTKRLTLTIDADQVDDTLTDFPVTIILSTASGISDTDVSCVFDELVNAANRKKIAVTTSAGALCYVEIDKWDQANEKAYLHVKVPSISSADDTVLYLYYDADQEDNVGYIGDTSGVIATNVWDDGYQMVLHSTYWNCYDSTRTKTPSLQNIALADQAAGQIGNAIDLAINEKIVFSGVVGSDPTILTVEALFKATAAVAIFSHRSEVTRLIQLFANTNAQIAFQMRGSGDSLQELTVDTDLTAWTYAAGVFNKAANAHSLHVNGGAPVPSTYDFGSETFTSTIDAIGCYYDTGFHYGPMVIDEFRISNVARTAAWLKATYHSLYDSLITYGSEETGSWSIESTAPSVIYEDFSTNYTEVDPSSDISVAKNYIDVVDKPADASSKDYVYRDMGAGYFNGDFVHQFVVQQIAWDYGGKGIIWMLSDTLGEEADIKAAGGNILRILLNLADAESSNVFSIYQYHGSSSDDYSNLVVPFSKFDRYVTVERDFDGGAGTGSLTVTIRMDSHEGTTIATDTITLAWQDTYRYIYGFGSLNISQAGYLYSGNVKNLYLGVSTPIVVPHPSVCIIT